jgi:hypothetical protein
VVFVEGSLEVGPWVGDWVVIGFIKPELVSGQIQDWCLLFKLIGIDNLCVENASLCWRRLKTAANAILRRWTPALIAHKLRLFLLRLQPVELTLLRVHLSVSA